MSKHFFLVSLLSLSITCMLLSSCGQVSSFQTGRTLGENNIEIGCAVEAYGGNDGGFLGVAVLPNAEAWAQYGVAEKADIGAKISTGGNIQILGKYQISGDQQSRFASSVGAGMEFQLIGEDVANVMRYHVPVYFSWHDERNNVWTITPRYMLQTVKGDENIHFLGTSGGHQWQVSDRIIIGGEGSLYIPTTNNLESQGVVFQIGVGARFKIGY